MTRYDAAVKAASKLDVDIDHVIEFVERARKHDWPVPNRVKDFVADWPAAQNAAKRLARTLEKIDDGQGLLVVDPNLLKAAETAGINIDAKFPRRALAKFLRAIATHRYETKARPASLIYGPLKIDGRQTAHLPSPAVATAVALAAIFEGVTGEPQWAVAAAFAAAAFELPRIDTDLADTAARWRRRADPTYVGWRNTARTDRTE